MSFQTFWVQQPTASWTRSIFSFELSFHNNEIFMRKVISKIADVSIFTKWFYWYHKLMLFTQEIPFLLDANVSIAISLITVISLNLKESFMVPALAQNFHFSKNGYLCYLRRKKVCPRILDWQQPDLSSPRLVLKGSEIKSRPGKMYRLVKNGCFSPRLYRFLPVLMQRIV